MVICSFDELNVQGNGHFLADKNGASFEDCVPGETKVFPVDLRCGGESDAHMAPRILLWRARRLHIKYNISGYSVNGEVAVNRQIPTLLLRDRCRLEN